METYEHKFKVLADAEEVKIFLLYLIYFFNIFVVHSQTILKMERYLGDPGELLLCERLSAMKEGNRLGIYIDRNFADVGIEDTLLMGNETSSS